MDHILFFYKQLQTYAGKIMYLNLIGMTLVSLLDGIAIFLLIPMISISGIMDINTGGIAIFRVFEFLQDIPQVIGLPIILGMYILLVTGQAFLQRNVTVRNVKIQQNYSRQLRISTYNSLLQANWDFFMKRRKSDLINSLTTDLARVSGGINLFLQFLTAVIFTVIQIGFALWLSVQMTIFVLVSGLILAWFSRKFIKRAKALGSQTSELAQSYLAGITDQLDGIKEIKSNTLEESYMKWIRSLTRRMNAEQIEYIKLNTASQLSYKISSAALIAIFIFLSLKLFHTHPEQLLLIVVIFSRLWPRFTGIQSNLEYIASTIPAFKALINLQEECNKASELMDAHHSNRDVEKLTLGKELSCQQIYFRYLKNDSRYTLENINLQIQANCMTAIVGPSGAGKSTLIDILMGLMEPDKGQVLIDSAPLTSDYLRSWRRSISYVPQDPFLFNGSIRENLLMIEPNATEEQIWEALEFSAAADFVRKLPQELDTVIGDRGIRLSGGERQRLVLGRAILRKPSILVLDEATSALDTENEVKIQEALEQLKGKMTIIVIAHCLSTIRNADQVIVLDQGKIIQKGGFSQLANEKRGMFSSLLGKQLEASL